MFRMVLIINRDPDHHSPTSLRNGDSVFSVRQELLFKHYLDKFRHKRDIKATKLTSHCRRV
jgi:hypothetical protein